MSNMASIDGEGKDHAVSLVNKLITYAEAQLQAS